MRADEALREWIRENGSALQKEQLAAGKLRYAEAVDTLRAALFAPLAGRERFEAVRREDVCRLHQGTSFSVTELSPVTLTQEAAVAEICAAMPEATVTVKRHLGRCYGCDARAVRYSAHVAIQWHERRLAREYLLPGE